jgi:type VI secretion system protein ImpA
MAIDIATVLKPVSAEAPCGPNLEYEPPFLALQELARGKPEQAIGDQIRPAQDPPWPAVREAAQKLFGSTKDLRVAGILHLALLKTEGIAGLDAGLGLIRSMLEQYWDHLHPQLDPDDDNDPTFRVNSLLAALVSDEALATVRAAPLVESRQFGKHSLRNHRIATGVLKTPSGDGQTDPQQELGRIEAAFADVPLEALTRTAALVGTAAEHLNALQHILLDRADGIPEDLKPLAGDIRDMKALLDGQLSKRGVSAGADGADQSGGGDTGDGAQPSSGAIRNRSDVLTTIDRICEYYARVEPSSPVPLLLQRAKRLVNKDFMDIIRDLTPAGVSEAETIGGLEKRNG